jgi:hypothetical protein
MPVKIAAAIICLGIAACAAPPVTPQNAGPAPENYKAILKAHIEKNYFDPYSLRNVAISKPTLGKIGPNPGWVRLLAEQRKKPHGRLCGIEERRLSHQERVGRRF